MSPNLHTQTPTEEATLVFGNEIAMSILALLEIFLQSPSMGIAGCCTHMCHLTQIETWKRIGTDASNGRRMVKAL